MYIGVQTTGPEPPDHHAYDVEGKLPFGYWMQRDTWTPVTYFDSAYKEEPSSGSAQTELLSHSQQAYKWELNCLYCNNTYPFQHRMYFGSALGFPREDYVFPGGTGVLEKWGALSPDNLVTLGISCESCHFGGREHVENGLPTKYVPSSPELSVSNRMATDPKSHPDAVNSICAQCHCAKVALYPNGAATWNSREALDLTSGACSGKIKCTDCHNPHLATSRGGLFSAEKIIEKCLSCHDQFRSDEARIGHTNHRDESANCLDCHMPRIVQGLDSVVRTHHICSPTDERMLKLAGPNACNLCHLDKSIQWTVQELNAGWNSKLNPGSDWSDAYGDDRDKPLGDVWLSHSRPMMRLLVSDAIARSLGQFEKLDRLLPLLRESYAVNRMFGLLAVEKVLGRKLTNEEFNPLARQADRNGMVEKLMKALPRHSATDSSVRPNPD